jgi:Fic family protein
LSELIRPFVPAELPPDPPIEISSSRQRLLERAMLSLCRLDTIRLPRCAFIRREAVLSSRINGSESSLRDLLLFELKGGSDARASDYVAALEHGLAGLRRGFPLCNRLIRDMHQVLLARTRWRVPPGVFRATQNWVGGTRPSAAHYVPPPPAQVENCMAGLELFIQAPCSPLIKAGLAHVQIEMIRPFFDGNGRISRMLVPLMTHPFLYLSLHFRDRLPQYRRLLDLVRAEGDWESWLDFFLAGVEDTASHAVGLARQLATLFNTDTARLRPGSRTLQVYRALCERPITTLGDVCRRTGMPFPAAANCVDRLMNLGIVSELTGSRRNRVFAYDRCLEILDC